VAPALRGERGSQQRKGMLLDVPYTEWRPLSGASEDRNALNTPGGIVDLRTVAPALRDGRGSQHQGVG
ncbi:hypothetical protein, partial [Actinomadura oligospora]|uniref:hypothetical protein n=1 Tax=Actinomadura oligospora TaxID=111804 RepID=UPI00054D1698